MTQNKKLDVIKKLVAFFAQRFKGNKKYLEMFPIFEGCHCIELKDM